MCHINILSKLDFSRRSAVQFGLKKHVKNTGITGILMAVYRYSVFAISIHSTLGGFSEILPSCSDDIISRSGQSPSGNIITSGNISPNPPRSRSINDKCYPNSVSVADMLLNVTMVIISSNY
jgi:hypothetical protein